MFTDMFPPLCNRIKIQLCDSDLTSDEVIATHFIQLSQIMDPGGDIEGSLCCNACGRFRSPFCRVFRLNLKCLRQKWDLVRKNTRKRAMLRVRFTSFLRRRHRYCRRLCYSMQIIHEKLFMEKRCVCVCVCVCAFVRACVRVFLYTWGDSDVIMS